MPTGPQGQKRPADAIGLAVMIGKIATGEIAPDAASPRRRSGLAGAQTRNESAAPEQRAAIARHAAKVRWGKGNEDDGTRGSKGTVQVC